MGCVWTLVLVFALVHSLLSPPNKSKLNNICVQCGFIVWNHWLLEDSKLLRERHQCFFSFNGIIPTFEAFSSLKSFCLSFLSSKFLFLFFQQRLVLVFKNAFNSCIVCQLFRLKHSKKGSSIQGGVAYIRNCGFGFSDIESSAVSLPKWKLKGPSFQQIPTPLSRGKGLEYICVNRGQNTLKWRPVRY